MSRLVVAFWLTFGLTLAAVAPALAQESRSADELEELIPGIVLVEVDSAQHSLEPVDYDVLPPAGGEHHPLWQNCGYYEELIIAEHAVHSQEHGAVWITYEPGLDDDQLAALELLATDNQYVLVTPFLDLPSPIVASAWGAQVQLDSADDPRLSSFIREFAGNGPEAGAPCSGGTSETIGLPVGTPVATPAATPA